MGNNLAGRRVDIAIVGAGAGGLAAALELRDRFPSRSILILEREVQTGGRVRSLRLPEEGGVVELGAGRFHEVLHGRLSDLTARFAVQTIAYTVQLAAMQHSLFEHNSGLLKDACASVESVYENSPACYREAKSFWDATGMHIGDGKRALLQEMIGYDTLSNPRLSFEAGFGIIRHHPETQAFWNKPMTGWRCYLDGFQSLTDRVAAHLRSTCKFALDSKVTAIEPLTGGHGSKITWKDGNSVVHEIDAGATILAIPMGALREIRGLPTMSRVYEEVVDVPLTKAYFRYPQRWWDGLGAKGNCFTTSSEFRKLYFPAHGRFLLAYCDGDSAIALNTLMKDPQEAKARLVSALREAMPLGVPTDMLAPDDIGVQHWPRGISFWSGNVGRLPRGSWQIGPGIYYCSDLCTDFLGWVEGALVSAHSAAAKVIEEIESRHGRPLPVRVNGDLVS